MSVSNVALAASSMPEAISVQGVAVHPLLNTAQAAAYLGLGKNTLEQARLSGNGPAFVKMAASVRYRLSDLDAYVAARVRTSTAQAA